MELPKAYRMAHCLTTWGTARRNSHPHYTCLPGTQPAFGQNPLIAALHSLCCRCSAGVLLPHRVHGLSLRYAGVVAVADGVHGIKGPVEEEDSEVVEAFTA